MTRAPITIGILLASMNAFADPILRVGTCPPGYYSSGGYCMPSSPKSPTAVPKIGTCPIGYYGSDSYCIQSTPGPVAIPKVGSCPAGYYSSGAYCKESK